MKYYVEAIEESTSKTGNQFLKVTCTGTDKQKHLFYLWDSVITFQSSYNAGNKIMDLNVDSDPNFPKITSFNPTNGDITEFYSFIYESDERAESIFNALLNSIDDPLLKQVCEKVFLSPGPGEYLTVKDAFIEIPAAKAYHHDYRYGLLEHTHQVMTFINRICEAPMFSGSLDKQLALTAGLLHDVGKVYEYSFNGVSCDYGTTYEVNQIYMGSHLYKGAEMVAIAFSQLSDEHSPQSVARIEHLKHCIMAHHLQRDWAAIPKQPQTLEAYLCFLADYFSAAFGKFNSIDWSNVSPDNLFGSTSKFDSFFGFNKLI